MKGVVCRCLVFLALVTTFTGCELLFVSGKGPENLTANPTGSVEILSFTSNNESGTFEYRITNSGESNISTVIFNLIGEVDLTPEDPLDNSFRTIYKTITHSQLLSGGQVFYGKEQVPLSKINGDTPTIISKIDAKIVKLSQVSGSVTDVSNITVSPTQPGDQSSNSFNFTVDYHNLRNESINKKQKKTGGGATDEYFPELNCDFFYMVKQKDDKAYYFQKYNPALGTTENSNADSSGVRKLTTTHSFTAMDTPFLSAKHTFSRFGTLIQSNGNIPLRFNYEVVNNNAIQVKDYLVYFKATDHSGVVYRSEAPFSLSGGEKTIKEQVINMTSSHLKKLEIEKVAANPSVNRYEKLISLNLDNSSIIFRK